ncbi:MAG TPA: GNAT family N-acetyltransferase [Candidatus Wallbacteria bacterium]|nr:GNAT family N-acetyltransferase [Candidatus Wallbacteria bacterium]
MIRIAATKDYEAWIALAKEVEALFGPMAEIKEFQEAIMECINTKNAYCVEEADHEIAGFIALDREKNEIAWLAVGEKFRNKGYGDILLKKAIEELRSGGAIYVQTFAPKEEKGKSALSLYEKNGFEFFKEAGLNPAGVETIIMINKF